jgi:hypothetical protein
MLVASAARNARLSEVGCERRRRNRAARTGDTVTLTPNRDWRIVAERSSDGSIDHEEETTTYTGTDEQGREWSVAVVANQVREEF